jgi:hypothetical protein
VLAYLGVAFAGFMFLAAGLIKALDPLGFTEQITYDLPFLEPLAYPLALAGTLVEILLGTAYLLGIRHRLLIATGLIMVVIFLAITVPKIGTDEAAGCGCFGNFVIRTPAETATEDLLMMAGLLLGLAGGSGARLVPWRWTVLGLAALVGVIVPPLAPSLPLDNFATRLKPGATVVDIQFRDPIPELEFGRHIVILNETLLEACEEVPESLYQLADSSPDTRFWYVLPSEEGGREGVTWLCLFGAEVVDVPRPVVRTLYRTLPRSFEMVDGTVTRTWEGFPAAQEEP